MKKYGFIFVLSLFLAACNPGSPIISPPNEPTTQMKSSQGPLSNNTEYADFILTNGTIITMDKNNSIAEGIAIKGNKILAVGAEREVLKYQGTNTKLMKLNGYTIMPGFIDTHNHLLEAHAKNFAEEQALILENGVTTIGILYAMQEWIDELGAFNKQTGLRIRVNLYLNYNNACGEIYGDWYKKFPPTQDKSAMLRIAGVKVYADGGSCNAPAVSYEYPAGGHGDLYFTQDKMNQVVREINNNGYQAAIHALGDRAIEQVLNAIKNANVSNKNVMRNRIEHNTLIRDDMLGRHDESGAVAIIFGHYPTCYFLGKNEKAKPTTPEEIKQTEWCWKDLINANPNTVFAWHTDVSTVYGPKAFGFVSLNPFASLNGFVTRREYKEDGSICEPEGWMMENTISVEQALPIMTINSAYALGMDDVIGSLEPGKFADMVIVSENPLRERTNDLKDIKVLMTMVGGKVEFCAEGHEAVCPKVIQQGGTESALPASLPQFIQVKANCNKGKESPIHVEKQKSIQISLPWAAKTTEQVNNYLSAVSTTILIDGKQKYSNVSNSSIEKLENSDLFFVQSIFDVGVLESGKHEIKTVITFNKKIYDGIDYYGPETKNPRVEVSCTVIIE